MNIISILAGPIIGAVIGYCTNYIAVKMLFRPYKPLKIGKLRMPFTPGIIPKRKNDLAKAVGDAVAGHLFTENDLQESLLSDDMKQKVVTNIMDSLENIGESYTLTGLGNEMMGEEKTTVAKGKLIATVTQCLQANLEKVDLGKIIAEKGGEMVAEKLKGSMLSMFLSPDKINSFIAPMGGQINEYIKENGYELIQPLVATEFDSLCEAPLSEVGSKLNVEKSDLQLILMSVYEKLLCKQIVTISSQLDIAGIVRSRIEAMEMAELEQLVLSVIRKELRAIVNLGGLIGFIIGCLMILF